MSVLATFLILCSSAGLGTRTDPVSTAATAAEHPAQMRAECSRELPPDTLVSYPAEPEFPYELQFRILKLETTCLVETTVSRDSTAVSTVDRLRLCGDFGVFLDLFDEDGNGTDDGFYLFLEGPDSTGVYVFLTDSTGLRLWSKHRQDNICTY